MAIEHIDAGQLGERIEILRLEKIEPENAWSWTTLRHSWAGVELQQKRNNFSTHGIGAAGAELVLRRQELTLLDAIRWRGQHLFLTGIAPRGRNHLTVAAALVEVRACRDPESALSFPGVVTEKYLGHQQEEPMAVNTMRHILITHPAIDLKPGRLVEVDGESWPITMSHRLDPWKAEYEIERVIEL